MSVTSLYVTAFFIALGMSLTMTPLVRKAAIKLDIVDRPDAKRKIHFEAIPYLGGISIYLGTMAGFFFVFGHVPQFNSLLVGASAVLLIGLVDDRYGMNPLVKLTGQIGAAFLAVHSGMRFELFGTVLLDYPLGILWIVGITNAINLLDNMDGLSSGIVAISSFFLFLVSAAHGQYLVSAVFLALCGACLGFLWYNFEPATIFMGDTGSLFIGYVLAVTAMKFRLPWGDVYEFLVPVMALALPILDTTLVTWSRTAKGRKVYLGGKDHTSHRLVQKGLSHRRSVLCLYGLNAICGVAANLLRPHNAPLVGGAAIILFAFTLTYFLKLPEIPVGPAKNQDAPQEA